MPVVLGVDSSTQATKVEVRDADRGKLLASGRAPHPPTQAPGSEQEPAAWWEALRDARRAAAGGMNVAAVSVAAQQHGMLVLDRAGTVIRPAKLWNDTESAPQARTLVNQLGPRSWSERCGSVPVPSFTITKLAWLREHEPESFGRIALVLLPHDWLTSLLARRYVTDRGDASGTGYWSPAEGRWRTDLLALVDDSLDWERCLPEVLGPTEAAAVRDGVVIAPGTGDNMAAALGVGLQPGDVAISLGTSGTVFTVSDTATADPSGAVAGFADATGRFLPLVCTLNATRATDTVARWLGADHARFDRLALESSAGARGVTMLPYFDGERTPNRPGATGTLFGLRTDTTAENIARAACEGVVCGLLDGIDALRAVGVRVDGRIVLVGGGARSHAYQRVLADLSGRTIYVLKGTEHAATGACVQAAATLHGVAPEKIAEAWGVATGRAIEPDQRVDADAIRTRYAAARG